MASFGQELPYELSLAEKRTEDINGTKYLYFKEIKKLDGDDVCDFVCRVALHAGIQFAASPGETLGEDLEGFENCPGVHCPSKNLAAGA